MPVVADRTAASLLLRMGRQRLGRSPDKPHQPAEGIVRRRAALHSKELLLDSRLRSAAQRVKPGLLPGREVVLSIWPGLERRQRNGYWRTSLVVTEDGLRARYDTRMILKRVRWTLLSGWPVADGRLEDDSLVVPFTMAFGFDAVIADRPFLTAFNPPLSARQAASLGSFPELRRTGRGPQRSIGLLRYVSIARRGLRW